MAQFHNFDTMNETDVREAIVRPLIERLEYRHGTDANIITEKTLRYEKAFLGRKNPKKDPPLVGRADYILEVVSFGRWVVEVKSPAEPISQDAIEQAHTYASHPEIAASFSLSPMAAPSISTKPRSCWNLLSRGITKMRTTTCRDFQTS